MLCKQALFVLLLGTLAGTTKAPSAGDTVAPSHATIRTWETFNRDLEVPPPDKDGEELKSPTAYDPKASFGGRPLKVFVVPWSHNEPGWKLTYTHYFTTQTTKILETVVNALDKNPNRYFIWAETCALQRWYAQTNEANKMLLRKIIHRGQLEVVTGGWVMADEGLSHYEGLLDELLEGHDWLIRALGVRPSSAFAVDVLGHSPTMAYLLSLAGINGMVINRIHYAFKKELAHRKDLEFLWRQSWEDDKTNTDMMTHVMPFSAYDVPHTCGPTPKTCALYDFQDVGQRTQWGDNIVRVTPENVASMAEKLLEQYRQKAMLFKTNVLYVPLGNDWSYSTGSEIENQYNNYQLLFNELNKPQYNTAIRFSNLSDYIGELRKSHKSESLSVVQGDFIPYADQKTDYWTGFYSNRPFFKRAVRSLHSTTRSVQVLFTLLSTWNREPADKDDLPTTVMHARRAVDIYHHHGGITGLASKAVVRDYGRMLHEARWDMKSSLLLLVQHALSIEGNPEQPPQEDFESDESKTRSSELPIQGILRIPPSEELRPLIVYNSLPQIRPEVITIFTDSPYVTVRDAATDDVVPSQICPFIEFAGDSFRIVEGKYKLSFAFNLPALSVHTFFVVTSDDRNGEGAAVPCETITLNGRLLSAWLGGKASIRWESSNNPCIENRKIKACFENGFISQLAGPQIPAFKFKENFVLYRSARSGSVVFAPDGTPELLGKDSPSVMFRGPILEEVVTRIGSSTRSIKVYQSADTFLSSYFDVSHQISINSGELAVRYTNDVENGNTFFTDLNGLSFSQRTFRQDLPISANIYPITSTIFWQDSTRRVSIHTSQAFGAGCFGDGRCEIILDRNAPHDDGKGIGDRLDDNLVSNTVTRIVVEPPLSTAVPATSLMSHTVRTRLNHALQFVFGKTTPISQWQERFGVAISPLTNDLPEDVTLVSLRRASAAVDTGEYLIVLARALISHSTPPDEQLACLSLAELFRCADIVDIVEHTLTFMSEKENGENPPTEGNVCLAPGTIRSFTFNVKIDAECDPPGVPSPILSRWHGQEKTPELADEKNNNDNIEEKEPGINSPAPGIAKPAQGTYLTAMPQGPDGTSPAAPLDPNTLLQHQPQQPEGPPATHQVERPVITEQILPPAQQEVKEVVVIAGPTKSAKVAFWMLSFCVFFTFLCYRKKRITSGHAVLILTCIMASNGLVVMYSGD